MHVALYAIAAAGWWLGFLDASLVHKHFLVRFRVPTARLRSVPYASAVRVGTWRL